MPGSVAAAVPAALVVGSLLIAMAAAAAPATVDRYPHAADRVTVVDVDGRGAVRGAQRTFEVVAWLAERRLVLYVPEIEAATSVVARIVGGAPFDVASVEADTAARSLIAELTGLDESMIRCEIRLRPGRGGAVT
jgi:hypothetical protein